MLHIKFDFNWSSGFREEDLENGGRRRRTDGRRRTPDHGHPISSPCEPNGSGELKIKLCSALMRSYLTNVIVGNY